MTDTPLRLGTRGSLLAVAQSRLVAETLTRQCPGLAVECVNIDTRGDRDRHTPLQNVRDGAFFSAELETALLAGDIDFCVHSLKDLQDPRPAGIRQVAFPARDDPRDIIVFRPDILQRLRAGRPIRIGSSSRRRQAAAEEFLPNALPVRPRPQPVFHSLRGPVDERLRTIHRDPAAPDALDGVILALAGLNRLRQGAGSNQTIARLLAGTRRMVLPLSACPTAPGQGVLAIECRSDDRRTGALLRRLHDRVTADCVRREHAFTAARSAADRGDTGATALTHATLGHIMFTRSGSQTGLFWPAPPKPARSRPWDGASLRSAQQQTSRPLQPADEPTAAVFVAHWRAVTDTQCLSAARHVWVSGTESWRRLARQGIWVEGCADNLGFAALRPTLGGAGLDLPPLAAWTVLTHRDAVPGWAASGVGRVLATHAIDGDTNTNEPPGALAEIGAATHYFWGSIGQFRQARPWLNRSARHACGGGKTAAALRAEGVTCIDIFPSRQAWQIWLG